MRFDKNEFNFSGKSYFGKRGRSRLPSVLTLFQRDAVDTIKKIPAISFFLHGILDQMLFSLTHAYNIMSMVPCQEMAGSRKAVAEKGCLVYVIVRVGVQNSRRVSKEIVL
jgi:hypothetical protein